MSQPIQTIHADFFGTAVNIIDHNGQRWLTAEEAGLCLGYNEANARQGANNLYKRHDDEFTEADTCVINLMTQGQHREVRIFSQSGCVLLSMFSNTPRAKQFRTWAKQVLAAKLNNSIAASTVSPELLNVVSNIQSQLSTLTVATQASIAALAQALDVTQRYTQLLETHQRKPRRECRPVTREDKTAIDELAAQGLSDADIARHLGISRTSVSLIRRDKYRFSQAFKADPNQPAV